MDDNPTPDPDRRRASSSSTADRGSLWGCFCRAGVGLLLDQEGNRFRAPVSIYSLGQWGSSSSGLENLLGQQQHDAISEVAMVVVGVVTLLGDLGDYPESHWV